MKRFALVPRVAAMPTKKKTTAARPQKDARRDQSAAINPPAPDINIAALGEDLLAVCLSFVKAQGSAATNLPAIVKLAVCARPPPPPPPFGFLSAQTWRLLLLHNVILYVCPSMRLPPPRRRGAGCACCMLPIVAAATLALFLLRRCGCPAAPAGRRTRSTLQAL